jgi:hypothetical protein
MLRNGLNRLEADVCFYGEKADSRRGGFLALLKLFYADGSVDFICSDNSWRVAAVPQRKDGEIRRDAKIEKVEIFDNSIAVQGEFAPASVVCDPEAGYWKKLIPGNTPRLTRREVLIHRVIGVKVSESIPECGGGSLSFRNSRIENAPPGTVEDIQALIYPDDRCTVIDPASGKDVELCCDLGVPEVGCWNFVLHAPAGTVVDVSCAEEVCPDGSVFLPEGAELKHLRYICRAGWNRFTAMSRLGGRYVFVTLRNMTGRVRFQSLRLVESTYPVVPCGAFSSPDHELNRIFDTSCHALKLCMEDVLVDGPLCGQHFAVDEFRNEALFALNCFGADDLVRRSLKLAFDRSRGTDGKYLSGADFFPVFALADAERELGDEKLLRELLPEVFSLLEHAVKQLDENCGLLKSFDSDGVNHSFLLRDTLLFKGAMDTALRLAEKIGMSQLETSLFRACSERLSAAVLNLWDELHLAFCDGLTSSGEHISRFSVENSMLALLFDVIPENCRASLCADVISPRGEQTVITSPVTGLLWLETLEKIGVSDLIIEKIRAGSFDDTSGKNCIRGASALALSVFPRHLLGLRTCDGCRSFKVSPFVQELDYASGSRWTPYGQISVSWRKEPDRVLVIDVSAPHGVNVEYQENILLKEFNVQFNVSQSGKV